MKLLDSLFRSDDMQERWSDRACLQGMLDFEAGLARAEARSGVIPSSAAAAIAAKCKAELFDVAEIARGAGLAGNIAIPLVKALTALVAQSDKDATRYVHWGATSQDAIDTGSRVAVAAGSHNYRERSGPVGTRARRAGDETSFDDCGGTHLDAASAPDNVWREGGGVAGCH